MNPMVHRRGRLFGLLAAATIALHGCGDGTSVGGGELTEGLGDAVDLERLGEASEEPTPEVDPEATPEATTAPSPSPSPSATPAPPAEPRPSPTAPAIVVTINPDGGTEPAFSPRIAEVPAGSTVTWTNQDSVERTVVASNGSFSSPALAPGESWSLTFELPGTYDYSDGTRVYALGTIEVAP